MQVEIERLDNSGRGIGYVNGKVIFVPKTMPGDVALVEIVKEDKKYLVGKLIELKKKSNMRVDCKCPYFNKCGGCDLLMMNYNDTLQYKVDKIKNLLSRNNLDIDVSIVENPNPFNYRNKVSLKIVDGLIGYYESDINILVNVAPRYHFG